MKSAESFAATIVLIFLIFRLVNEMSLSTKTIAGHTEDQLIMVSMKHAAVCA